MPRTSSRTPIRINDIIHPFVAGLISVNVNYGGTFIGTVTLTCLRTYIPDFEAVFKHITGQRYRARLYWRFGVVRGGWQR